VERGQGEDIVEMGQRVSTSVWRWRDEGHIIKSAIGIGP